MESLVIIGGLLFISVSVLFYWCTVTYVIHVYNNRYKRGKKAKSKKYLKLREQYLSEIKGEIDYKYYIRNYSLLEKKSSGTIYVISFLTTFLLIVLITLVYTVGDIINNQPTGEDSSELKRIVVSVLFIIIISSIYAAFYTFTIYNAFFSIPTHYKNQLGLDLIYEQNSPKKVAAVMIGLASNQEVNGYVYALELAQKRNLITPEYTQIIYREGLKLIEPKKFLRTNKKFIPTKLQRLIEIEFFSSGLGSEFEMYLGLLQDGEISIEDIKDAQKSTHTQSPFKEMLTALVTWAGDKTDEEIQEILIGEKENYELNKPESDTVFEALIIPDDLVIILMSSEVEELIFNGIKAIHTKRNLVLLPYFIQYLSNSKHKFEGQFDSVFDAYQALNQEQKKQYPNLNQIFCPHSGRYAQPYIPQNLSVMGLEESDYIYYCPVETDISTYLYPVKKVIGMVSDTFSTHLEDSILTLGLWNEAERSAKFSEISILEIPKPNVNLNLHLDWAIAAILQKMRDFNWSKFEIKVAKDVILDENTWRLIREQNDFNS